MSASGETCRRFIITGRVQGVFFRDSTRRVALRLGLTGHARNRSDGTVEVLACGPADGVDKLEQWLQDGPRMAAVAGVRGETVDVRKPREFSIA